MQALPEDAFTSEQRPWLAKLVGDHMGYNSLALCIADGLVTSRGMVLEELEREMRIDFSDEQDSEGSVEQ